MVKTIGIIENNSITGVKYGTVEITENCKTVMTHDKNSAQRKFQQAQQTVRKSTKDAHRTKHK